MSESRRRGCSFSCLCGRLLAWIKVLEFPPVMPSVFIVWVKQISPVSEFNSFSPSLAAPLHYLALLFLSHLSSSHLLSLCLHRSPCLSNHRHLQPVGNHSAEGKPWWGKPPCRGASLYPAWLSHPTRTRSPKDSTAPGWQATDGSRATAGTAQFGPCARAQQAGSGGCGGCRGSQRWDRY